jgi:hypothetical protein
MEHLTGAKAAFQNIAACMTSQAPCIVLALQEFETEEEGE